MLRAARAAAVGVLHRFRQRAKVPLAKVAGGVALFFQQLGQRQLLRLHVAAVRERNAVAEWVPTGDATAARRAADRCRRIKPVELHSPLGHCIEVRRADDLVAIKPHVAPAKVITHDEHNVGSVYRIGSV